MERTSLTTQCENPRDAFAPVTILTNLAVLSRPFNRLNLSRIRLRMAAANQISSVLTLAEAARELRCSKAHVSNVVNGKVPHLPRLPVVRIGRRVLIRYEALLEWIRLAEQASGGCYDSARSEFIA